MTDDEGLGPKLWFNAERMMDDARTPQLRLAQLLSPHEISRPAALGMLVTFLSNAVEQMKDDNMAAFSDDTIETWARWEHEPGVGAKALRKLLQNESGRLDWDMLRPWVRRSDPYAVPPEPRLRPPLR